MSFRYSLIINVVRGAEIYGDIVRLAVKIDKAESVCFGVGLSGRIRVTVNKEAADLVHLSHFAVVEAQSPNADLTFGVFDNEPL